MQDEEKEEENRGMRKGERHDVNRHERKRKGAAEKEQRLILENIYVQLFNLINRRY